MDHTEYFLSNPPCLSMPVSDADKLLSCSNLLCIKLYLYLLRAGKSVTLERTAEDLGAEVSEVKKAAKELKAMGLMGVAGKGTVPPEQAIPEYEKSYIAKRSMMDELFVALQEQAAHCVGHSLSAQELNTLFGIYDHLGLPAEVIYMLMTFCMEEIQEKYGPGRLPTMRQLEKQAFVWANNEIMTMEMAELYIERHKRRKEDHGQIKRMLGIWDRALTKTETDFINDWLDKGFDLDAIAMAFDRTVTQVGSFKPAYMNKIIQNWHKKNLHTPAEIEAGDKPMGKTPTAAPARQQVAPAATNEKDRLMQLMREI